MTDRLRPFAAILFATLCAVGVVVMPMLVGVSIERFGLDVGQAGRIASIEFLGVAVGSLIVAALVVRRPARLIATGIAGCVAAGNGLTLALDGEALEAWRFVAGLGEGGAIALMGALLASGPNADRYFGLFFSAYLLSAALLFSASGPISAGLAGAGIHGLLLLFCAPALAVAWAAFPATTLGSGAAAKAGQALDRRRVGLGLAAMLLFFVAAGGVWVYMERIGLSAGLDADAARAALGAATLAGAAGAALAAGLGPRWGRRLPLLVGVGAMVAVLSLVAAGLSRETFPIVAAVFVFGWMFAIPFMMGAMALLDPQGRAVSVSVGVQNGGQALGPALASFVVGDAGFTPVAGLAVVLLLASLGLHLVVLRAPRTGQ